MPNVYILPAFTEPARSKTARKVACDLLQVAILITLYVYSYSIRPELACSLFVIAPKTAAQCNVYSKTIGIWRVGGLRSISYITSTVIDAQRSGSYRSRALWRAPPTSPKTCVVWQLELYRTDFGFS